jgi:hypothetical protein
LFDGNISSVDDIRDETDAAMTMNVLHHHKDCVCNVITGCQNDSCFWHGSDKSTFVTLTWYPSFEEEAYPKWTTFVMRPIWR